MAKKRSWWKRTRRKWAERVVPPLASAILRLIYRTIRLDIRNRKVLTGHWSAGESAIYAFWHGRMLMFPPVYEGPGMAILISLHHDGELIARTMHGLGFRTVRGSTSAGASAAAKKMVRMLREGVDIAITPDGPRGPRYVVPEGVVELARLSGRPVIPCSASADRGKLFASWDRFLLPYPFAKCLVHIGDPIAVPRRLAPEEVGAYRERIEGEMRRLTDLADRECGREPGGPQQASEG